MTTELSLFTSGETLQHGTEVARVFANSGLMPDALRKNGDALANAIICFEVARMINVHPLTVMQEVYFVHGTPSFSSKFKIALVNRSGVLENPIDFEEERAENGYLQAVEAFAVLKATGKRVSFRVTMQMAQGEGWTKNPKYKSMPELMLRYRAASFLIRLYCPEVLLGLGLSLRTTEELLDDDRPIQQPIETTATVVEPQPDPLTRALGMDDSKSLTPDENWLTDQKEVDSLLDACLGPVPEPVQEKQSPELPLNPPADW